MVPRWAIKDSLFKDEYGDAELLAQLYQGRLCYDHSEKSWYRWAGHAWQRDRTGIVRQLVGGQVAAQYLQHAALARRDAEAEADEQRATDLRVLEQRLIERAIKLRKLNRVLNILGFAQSKLGITGDEWDSDPWLLGVQNGVIDMRSGEFRPGRPEDAIRATAPTTWSGLDSAAPRWEQFLREIFEDSAEASGLIGFLQRMLGYGTTGLTTEHIFPIMWGARGRNGKDTLLKILEHVLGPLAGAVSSDVLVAASARTGGAAQPHLVDLRGKRLAWASETNEGARLNAGQVKLVTGGGRISTRPLYGNQMSFDPTHLLILITNNKPHAPADDDALWERVKLIPFTMRFVDKPIAPNERKRDSNLGTTLRSEASGILAWLVRGCLDWQRQGLNPPDSVALATREYKQAEDTISLFLEECCVVHPTAIAGTTALYRVYKAWADEMNLRPMTGTAFGTRLGERFEKKHTRTGNVYQGIGLLAREGFDPTPDQPFTHRNGASESAKTNGYHQEREGYESESQDFPLKNPSRDQKITPALHTLHTLHTDLQEQGDPQAATAAYVPGTVWRAMWRNKDHDEPRTIIADLGVGPDGRRYFQAEGYSSGIPADEVELVEQVRAQPPTTAVRCTCGGERRWDAERSAWGACNRCEGEEVHAA